MALDETNGAGVFKVLKLGLLVVLETIAVAQEEDDAAGLFEVLEVVAVGVDVGFRGPGEKGYDGLRCEKVGVGGYCLMATVGLTVDFGADTVGL